MVLELSTYHASELASATALLVEDVLVVVLLAALADGERQVVELPEALLFASVVEDVVAMILPALSNVEDVQGVVSPAVLAATPWVVTAVTALS